MKEVIGFKLYAIDPRKEMREKDRRGDGAPGTSPEKGRLVVVNVKKYIK